MKSLYQISQQVLKSNLSGLTDIGTIPVKFIEYLLPSLSVQQLRLLELNSPQLITETNLIWKSLSIKDFVSIRIKVEDNKLGVIELTNWREIYREAERDQEERMKRVLVKMRSSYDAAADRATTVHFDGVQAENLKKKKRKLNIRSNNSSSRRISTDSSSYRSTSLFSQVKSEAKRISSRFTPPSSSKPKSFASAFPSSSSLLRSNISSTFSSSSNLYRSNSIVPPPVIVVEKPKARPTAFSTSGGGFIQPRQQITSTTNTNRRSATSVATNPIKIITRTVSVKVPTSNTNTNTSSPSRNQIIPIHSPRSNALPRIHNNTSMMSNLGKHSRS